MASLYKRANPEQKKILRIIEGAVRNAAHDHDFEFPPRLAKSIAKRATGTLTAPGLNVSALLASQQAARR